MQTTRTSIVINLCLGFFQCKIQLHSMVINPLSVVLSIEKYIREKVSIPDILEDFDLGWMNSQVLLKLFLLH